MPKHLAAAAAILTIALGLAACGNSGSGGGGDSLQRSKVSLDKGVKGGELSILSSGDVDYIDPGQTYYAFGFQVQLATNRGLYAIKPGGDESKPSPDLATGPPEITSDNKTITVHIKSGIKYSPPLQTRVITTRDIKYAIERAFTKQVPTSYVGPYFGDLVGAPAKPSTGDYKTISGIETPDDTTLVLKFSKPVAALAAGALQMPVTVPVPESYARPFDQNTPSTYNQHVVFNGPYMVANDSSGKLTGYRPGKLIQLVRNPSWDPKSDYRPAYLDKITIKEGNNDASVASRQALEGTSVTCCGDGAHPPADILKLAVRKYPSQLTRVDGGGGHWVGLNTTVAPLNDINFRKALIAITNRYAQRQASGGPILGKISTGIIPPGMPGFEEAGGDNQAQGMDWLASEKGDAAVAKKYMLLAKKDGLPIDSSGKYTDSTPLLVILANTPAQLKFGQLYKADWEKLGLQVKLRQVPQDTVYTKFCGVPKEKTPVCTSVGFSRDFQDPETMFDATFYGPSIIPNGNTNWSQLNDPTINAAMAKAKELPIGEQRNKAWAQINHMILEQAPTIPLIWDDNIQANSKNVVGIVNVQSTSLDLAFSWLRKSS